MPLLLVLLGILERLHPRMGSAGLPQGIFRVIHLVGLAALVLSIIGGTKVQSSDKSSHDTGKDCLEAGSLVFLGVYVALALLTILTAFRGRAIPYTENILIFVGVGVLPVLCARIVYTVATSWSSAGSIFYYLAPHVVVQATMQFAMEAIAIVIYSWGGIVVPKAKPVNTGDVYKDVEEQKMTGSGQRQSGYAGQQRVPRQQPQRNIGDYRPSRLIRNAISSRN